MRLLGNILMLIAGATVALVTVGWVRSFSGGFGAVSLAAIMVTIVVFFSDPDRTFAFSVGVGLGSDVWSAYPFFTWTALLLGAASLGIWLFRSYFTNRSLFSFLILGLTIHVYMAVSQFVVSNIGSLIFHQSIALAFDGGALFDTVKGMGIGLIILFIVFSVYTRVRGRSAATKLAFSPTWRSS